MSSRLIPTVDDFTSARIVDTYDDMINPPGLTNHVTVVQMDHDVVAVRALNVPPVSSGDSCTGQLFIDGRLARSFGGSVACTWRPDRVLRELEIDNLSVRTLTVVPHGEAGVLVQISVTNNGADRELELGFSAESAVVHAHHTWTPQIDTAWADPYSPTVANTITADGALRIGKPADNSACSVQGLTGDGWEFGGLGAQITAKRPVAAGETVQLTWAYAIASGRDAGDAGESVARETFSRLVADPADALSAAEQQWNNELASIFTPGNDQFSGHLPVLHTTNEALRTLYWWGAMGVLYFRRDNPASILGRTYDTLMPKHWQTTTFIWDYSLSSQVHALLDPEVMRKQISHWVGLDIHSHFGTEWLTGGPVGYWYSVNDYAMTRLVNDYLRFTGDLDFLNTELAAADGEAKSIAGHVQDWSRAWHGFRSPTGLADYGGIDNLLECVSTYTHEVASLNGANVWCMRRAAEIAELQGRTGDAAELRADADELANLVLTRYIPGKGVFNTAMPDGTLVETRHCFDFATIGTTIVEDLPEQMRNEMVDFFVRELRTPAWLRALSPWDPNAAYSLRSDHQWNGAYPAWPPDCGRSAIALGRPETVAEWIPTLALSANQGPPGQAHFVEEAAPTIEGGARKTPAQAPYLIDWACSSSGSYCELVISGVFGIEVGLDGEVTANPVLEHFDPDARLTGLAVQGKTYEVSAAGVSVSE